MVVGNAIWGPVATPEIKVVSEPLLETVTAPLRKPAADGEKA